mgnify:CR=1 FL=1|tara:strand:- start:906 stop:2237 length:1332 start_codon:yes stop_codon:yes gene_type:complete
MNFLKNPLSIRVFSYLLVGFLYIYFLSIYSPLGVNWLDWHSHRVFNAIEYLRLNGFFASYGFSIWSSCEDCTLNSINWQDQIYLSVPFFPLSPYIFINHYWGKDIFLVAGPLLDKSVIIFTGILLAELGLRIFNSSKKPFVFPDLITGLAIFILFLSSPWTYKMFLASWAEIYFLMFMLIGLICLQLKKNISGVLFFFLAGVFHYIWAFIASIFYLLIIILPRFTNDEYKNNFFSTTLAESSIKKFILILSLSLPALVYVCMKLYASTFIEGGMGSSLFFRVGVSGNDFHNGGILGALQFLGGNRINTCVNVDNISFVGENLNLAIFTFNCVLSLSGMALISIFSIFGMSILLSNSATARSIFIPLAFSLLVFIMIFQQALSVHLMGFSYIFSVFFSLGVVSFLNYLSEYISSLVLKIIFMSPLVLGIIILSTRVSMMTGANG